MTRNGIVAPLGPFLSLPSTYTSSAVQMLPAWPRLLPRLGDLPSAQPTITCTYPIRTQSAGHAAADASSHLQCTKCASRALYQNQRVRGSRGSEETRRIGWLVLLPLVPPSPRSFQFPPPSLHTHTAPTPPAAPLYTRCLSAPSLLLRSEDSDRSRKEGTYRD